MKLFDFKKLSNSFIVPIVMSVLVLLSIYTVISSNSEKMIQKANLDQTAADLLRLGELSISDPLWNFNDVGVSIIGNAIGKPECGFCKYQI